MILADTTIHKRIKSGQISIEPFNLSFLQPATYDLRLDNEFLVFNQNQHECIDVKKCSDNITRRIKIDADEPFIIHPGQFVLANTFEVIGVDNKHVGWLEGKSSLGRIGLIIHATAGFLDPGNKLRMTLELSNLGSLPIKLYYKMKIAQMAFGELDTECKKPYGSKGLNSKYVGDMKVSASKIHENFN